MCSEPVDDGDAAARDENREPPFAFSRERKDLFISERFEFLQRLADDADGCPEHRKIEKERERRLTARR